jgi:hypothetical protein
MDDDLLECMTSVHAALQSAQTKVVQVVGKQRLSSDMREQLMLELNWIRKKIENAPS